MSVSKDKKTDLDELEGYMKAFDKLGVIGDLHDNDDNVYVDIKGNLAGGMPVILSIDADSGPWKGKSQRLLLIGMDEDGRAIVADSKDRKWFETDQRFKLTDIDERIHHHQRRALNSALKQRTQITAMKNRSAGKSSRPVFCYRLILLLLRRQAQSTLCLRRIPGKSSFQEDLQKLLREQLRLPCHPSEGCKHNHMPCNNISVPYCTSC